MKYTLLLIFDITESWKHASSDRSLISVTVSHLDRFESIFAAHLIHTELLSLWKKVGGMMFKNAVHMEYVLKL